MARAVSRGMQEKPPAVDADATEQLERPPADTIVAPPPGWPGRGTAPGRPVVDGVHRLRSGRAGRAAPPRCRGDLFSAARGAVGQPVGFPIAELIAIGLANACPAHGHSD